MFLKKSVLATAFVAISASMGVQAEEINKSGADIWTKCGIGGLIFQDIPVAALISNVTWDLGTTAVTSATASPDTCQGSSFQTAQFIMENYDALAEETSRGQGEHLNAVLALSGCAAEEHAVAIDAIRADMGSKVISAEYAAQNQQQKSADFFSSVQGAAASCQNAVI